MGEHPNVGSEANVDVDGREGAEGLCWQAWCQKAADPHGWTRLRQLAVRAISACSRFRLMLPSPAPPPPTSTLSPRLGLDRHHIVGLSQQPWPMPGLATRPKVSPHEARRAPRLASASSCPACRGPRPSCMRARPCSVSTFILGSDKASSPGSVPAFGSQLMVPSLPRRLPPAIPSTSASRVCVGPPRRPRPPALDSAPSRLLPASRHLRPINVFRWCLPRLPSSSLTVSSSCFSRPAPAAKVPTSSSSRIHPVASKNIPAPESPRKLSIPRRILTSAPTCGPFGFGSHLRSPRPRPPASASSPRVGLQPRPRPPTSASRLGLGLPFARRKQHEGNTRSWLGLPRISFPATFSLSSQYSSSKQKLTSFHPSLTL